MATANLPALTCRFITDMDAPCSPVGFFAARADGAYME